MPGIVAIAWQHQQKPPAGMLLPLLRGAVPGHTDEIQRIGDDVDNVLPIYSQDGDHRAQVEHYIKKEMPLLGTLEMKEVLQHGQMPGAGDRKKLRDPLDQAEKNGIEYGHDIGSSHEQYCSQMAV